MSSLVRLMLFKQHIRFRIVAKSNRNLQHPNKQDAKNRNFTLNGNETKSFRNYDPSRGGSEGWHPSHIMRDKFVPLQPKRCNVTGPSMANIGETEAIKETRME